MTSTCTECSKEVGSEWAHTVHDEDCTRGETDSCRCGGLACPEHCPECRHKAETNEEYRAKTWVRFSEDPSIPPAFVHQCRDGMRHTLFLDSSVSKWDRDAQAVFAPLTCDHCGKGGSWINGAWAESGPA